MKGQSAELRQRGSGLGRVTHPRNSPVGDAGTRLPAGRALGSAAQVTRRCSMRIRLIGDVHGLIPLYAKLIEDVPCSIQLGDMGFSHSYQQLGEYGIDPTRHRFVPGNHDDYPHLPSHALGDYGAAALAGFSFFYVRGALSVDRMWRTEGATWWPEEELTAEQGSEALRAYRGACPGIVLSHDCPTSVLPLFLTNPMKTEPSRTGDMLQRLLDDHRPSLWVFGHHHRTWQCEVAGTQFVCLGELDCMDYDTDTEQGEVQSGRALLGDSLIYW